VDNLRGEQSKESQGSRQNHTGRLWIKLGLW
jgi:hypothetical protein